MSTGEAGTSTVAKKHWFAGVTFRTVLAIYLGCGLLLSALALVASSVPWPLGDSRFSLAAEAEVLDLRTGDQPFNMGDLDLPYLELHGMAGLTSFVAGELDVGSLAATAGEGGRLALSSLTIEPSTRVVVAVLPDGKVEIAFPEGGVRDVELVLRQPFDLDVTGLAGDTTIYWLSISPDSGFRVVFGLPNERPLLLARAIPVEGLSFTNVDLQGTAESIFSTLRHGEIEFEFLGRPQGSRLLRDGDVLEFSGLSGHVRQLIAVSAGGDVASGPRSDGMLPVTATTGVLQLLLVGEANTVWAGFGDDPTWITPSLLDHLLSSPAWRIAGGILLAIALALLGTVSLRQSPAETPAAKPSGASATSPADPESPS